MADLAAANVTITVQDSRIIGRQRKTRVKIAFGDGALTYPAGGVPLPAADKFGMYRQLDYMVLTDNNDAVGIIWKFDQENKKLRGWIQGVVLSAAGSGTLDDHPLNSTADPLTAAAHQPGAALPSIGVVGAAGTSFLGALKELAATHTPAAQTLYAEATGW
jgi:hypothetical protein